MSPPPAKSSVKKIRVPAPPASKKKPTTIPQGHPPVGAVHGIVDQLLAAAVPMRSISLDPKNERTHSRQNLDAIRSSLVKYGQREPIVVNRRTGCIEAGHGRYIVMSELGWTHAAAVLVDDDPKAASGYRVAANRSAELAEWDDEKLLATLSELGDSAIDLGFTDAEIKKIEKSFIPPETPSEKTVTPTFGAKIRCPKCNHEWTEKAS